MKLTLIPADTRKSTRTDFILVCPDLKSSPPKKTFFCSASSSTPGTKVFWGDPLMYVHLGEDGRKSMGERERWKERGEREMWKERRREGGRRRERRIGGGGGRKRGKEEMGEEK